MMKKGSSLLLTLTFLISFTTITAQLTEKVKESIKQRIETGTNVSIVVGFIDGDKVDFFSQGKTALENGVAVDENSTYEIGSISKVFTTILLANQIVLGNMSLDDPISKYLPKTVKTPERNGNVVTIKDLATHTSGLPRMPDNFDPSDPANPFKDYSVEQMYDFLSSYELTRDIGESYEYSNYGMGLLGHILELYLGATYEQLVEESITNKLEMDNTGITFSEDMLAHLAKGHAFGEEVKNWDIISLAGAGGIRSTAVDMVKFIKANMMDNSPLSEAMKLSRIRAFEDKEKDFEIGLGWHYAANGKVVWHNGGTGGYRAFAGFNTENNKGVVVLTNSVTSVDNLGLYLLDGTTNLVTPGKKETILEIEVPEVVLDTYVGVYQLAPEFKITITKEENKLFLQATNQPRFQIYASSNTKFFLKVVEASIEFNSDEKGQITGLTLNQNGQTIPGKKIE